MISRFRLPLLALALALPLPAMAQSVQDFSLEPAPTPTPTSRAQGPVDTESGVVPVTPREIRTATPTPAPRPTPSPAPSGAATVQPLPAPTPTATRRPEATGAVERPVSRPVATPLPTPVEREPAATVTPPAGSSPVPARPSASPPASTPAPTQAVATDESGGDWLWYAGGAAVLLLLGGAGFAWQRRRANAPPPEIERPVVHGAATPALPVRDALTLRCEVVKLTRSAVYATLKYRLTLINRTDGPMADVRIGVDLVSAHSGAPMEQQVATEGTALETRHVLPRIAPRQNVSVEGEVKLPLAAAQVIRQGKLPLLVPLLRVRVDGAGEGALVKTFVVGQGVPDGGRVQPFRLDDAPRSYAPIAQRELA